MTRREWLEKFINLADRNAKALEYRKELRLRAQDLPVYIKQLDAYRNELASLLEEEKRAMLRVERLRKPKQAKRRVEKQHESDSSNSTSADTYTK